MLDDLDMNDALEVLVALQKGDVDEATRLRAAALGSPPSDDAEEAKTTDKATDGPPQDGRSPQQRRGATQEARSTRSRLLVMALQREVDVAQSLFKHAFRRQSRATGKRRRGIVVSYADALHALVQGLSFVESCKSKVTRGRLLKGLSFLEAGVESGAFVDNQCFSQLSECLDGVGYVQRLCRLEKSMWMHLGDCVGRLTRPLDIPSAGVDGDGTLAELASVDSSSASGLRRGAARLTPAGTPRSSGRSESPAEQVARRSRLSKGAQTAGGRSRATRVSGSMYSSS